MRSTSDDEVNRAITKAFRELFRVLSVTEQHNPPHYNHFDSDVELAEAIERLADTLAQTHNP